MLKELIQIQSELKCNKAQYNSFGKYSYRSCEDILEAVKPLLKKHDCIVSLSDEVVNIGERYYVKATASISSEQGVETVTAYAREAESLKGMSDSQITGTASSYARKYALNGLFLIDDTKDADTDEYANQTKAGENIEEDRPISKTEVKTLTQLSESYKVNTADICKRYNVNKLEDLSYHQYGAALRVFKSMEKKA